MGNNQGTDTNPSSEEERKREANHLLDRKPHAFPLWNHQGEKEYDVLLLGSSGVGKTALIQRLAGISSVSGGKLPLNCATLVDFCHVAWRDLPKRLILWDISDPQAGFLKKPDPFHLGLTLEAVVLILVFSLSDRKSFTRLRDAVIDAGSLAHLPAILVATHADVPRQPDPGQPSERVSSEEAREFAHALGLQHYLEVSATTGENVPLVKEALISLLCPHLRPTHDLHAKHLEEKALKQPSVFDLHLENPVP